MKLFLPSDSEDEDSDDDDDDDEELSHWFLPQPIQVRPRLKAQLL